MPLIARASTTVRNKNLLIVLMCAVFVCWFAYDGFIGYARSNDRLVERLRSSVDETWFKQEWRPEVMPWTPKNPDGWPGWAKADTTTRARMGAIAKEAGSHAEGWRSELDIEFQRWIVLGLAVATAGSIGWFIHCQRRRAIADEASVSPSPGVVIPWEKITRVNNARWNSHGIVEITYTDAGGVARINWFDDYKLEREPLLAILDQLSEKAVHAEFVPRVETAAPTDPPASSPPPPEPRGS